MYSQWWYIDWLNTSWFVWTIVWLVIGGNLVAPILFWALFRGKPLWSPAWTAALKKLRRPKGLG